MIELIFATNNAHKAEEASVILAPFITIKTLAEAGIHIDIPEPYDTLEENATQKSSVIYSLTKKSCFSEDTGLETEGLNGAPGVRSARYADDGLFDNNVDKLLYNLKDKESRNAQFRTVISLMLHGQEHLFTGICKGIILAKRRGANGFGYDPVFVPDGAEKTFAEMDMQTKNIFSHRKKALDQLLKFLQGQNFI